LHDILTGWVIEQSMDSVLPLVTAAQAVLIPVIIVSSLHSFYILTD